MVRNLLTRNYHVTLNKKFGVGLPRDISEAYLLDKENKNTLRSNDSGKKVKLLWETSNFPCCTIRWNHWSTPKYTITMDLCGQVWWASLCLSMRRGAH